MTPNRNPDRIDVTWDLRPGERFRVPRGPVTVEVYKIVESAGKLRYFDFWGLEIPVPAEDEQTIS